LTEEYPAKINVLLSKKLIPMDFNQVTASMTHQLLNRNARGIDSDHFYMLFETTLIEVREYIADKSSADPEFFANLFGEWFQDFFTYQTEKSKPFSKDLIVTFSDGSEWSIKVLDILAMAQNFDVKRKNKEIIIDAKDPLLVNDKAMVKWVEKYLKWDDIKDLVEEVKRPQPEVDYEIEWIKAAKRVQEWENPISIIEMITLDSEPIENDEEDD
jgi:hypothetical protein